MPQILLLQRSAGNAAVGRLLSAPAIQRRLEIDGDSVNPSGVSEHYENDLGESAFDDELEEEGGDVGRVSPAHRALMQQIVNVLKAMAASTKLYEFETWDLAAKWAGAQVAKLGAVAPLLAKTTLNQRQLGQIGGALAEIEVTAEKERPEKEAEKDEDEGGDEGKEMETKGAEKPKFHEFKSRADVDVSFTDSGEVVSEGKKAGKTTRRDMITKLGLGQHLDAGHAPTVSDQTLISQARKNQKNFKWSSDRAFLTAIEKAAPEFASRRANSESKKLDTDKDKVFVVDISPDDGYGYVQVGKRLFKVFPRQARIVAMAEGDFNTAYGLTGARDPSGFDEAYHKVEEAEAGRR